MAHPVRPQHNRRHCIKLTGESQWRVPNNKIHRRLGPGTLSLIFIYVTETLLVGPPRTFRGTPQHSTMDGLLRMDSFIGIGCIVLGLLAVKHFIGFYTKRNLPPGPTRWPIVGSALQIPQTYAWLTFSKWAKTYGNLSRSLRRALPISMPDVCN